MTFNVGSGSRSGRHSSHRDLRLSTPKVYLLDNEETNKLVDDKLNRTCTRQLENEPSILNIKMFSSIELRVSSSLQQGQMNRGDEGYWRQCKVLATLITPERVDLSEMNKKTTALGSPVARRAWLSRVTQSSWGAIDPLTCYGTIGTLVSPRNRNESWRRIQIATRTVQLVISSQITVYAGRKRILCDIQWRVNSYFIHAPWNIGRATKSCFIRIGTCGNAEQWRNNSSNNNNNYYY